MYQFKLIDPNVSLFKILAPVFDLLFCLQDNLNDLMMTILFPVMLIYSSDQKREC